MILRCHCEHEVQDKLYGKKNRVHNYAEKTKNWRCTVCGAMKEASIGANK